MTSNSITAQVCIDVLLVYFYFTQSLWIEATQENVLPTQDKLKLPLDPCPSVSATFPALFSSSLHHQKGTDSPKTLFKEKIILIYLMKKVSASVCLATIHTVKLIKIITCTDSFFPKSYCVFNSHRHKGTGSWEDSTASYGNVIEAAGLVMNKKLDKMKRRKLAVDLIQAQKISVSKAKISEFMPFLCLWIFIIF